MLTMLAAPQVMAADVAMTAEGRMEELKILDQGSDFTKGALVSENWGTEEDGTPYVERTYIAEINKDTRAITGSGRFVKTRNYGATGSVNVYATFSWDRTAQRTYVSNVSGNYYNGGGVSETGSPASTYGGNGTSNAWAQFSIRVNRNLGGWTTYSVIMNCNYTGSCDGSRI